MHQIDVLVDTDMHAECDAVHISRCANVALQREQCEPSTLAIKVVGLNEMTLLNETYRAKSGATNVLSFPMDAEDEQHHRCLGDIAICLEVVSTEAAEQQKTVAAHLAHMTVHGVLHLLGYDHQYDEDAALMEEKEVEVLMQLGFSNPYASTHTC